MFYKMDNERLGIDVLFHIDYNSFVDFIYKDE
jgi:hypothetical protein